MYNRPDMQPYQFGMLSAFGAPLMVFSGHKGATISLISPKGGQGKTTIQRMVTSAWGNPAELELLANDTSNAIMKRIGRYCNLPVVMDELTNQDSRWISEVVFQMTQGREKIRLTSDAKERTNVARWSTLLVTSSNTSLVQKVAHIRAGTDADANRIFEYQVINPGAISKKEADERFSLLDRNYGHAGEVFIKAVVTHQDMTRKLYEYYKEEIDRNTQASNPERYWVTACALNLAAGAIAKKVRLVNYDLDAIAEWSLLQFKRMRGVITDNVRSNVEVL